MYAGLRTVDDYFAGVEPNRILDEDNVGAAPHLAKGAYLIEEMALYGQIGGGSKVDLGITTRADESDLLGFVGRKRAQDRRIDGEVTIPLDDAGRRIITQCGHNRLQP